MFYNSVDDLNKKYDVIIIGSGLGGLTAANVLAKKFGYRVAVLEHHFEIGGLAAYFRRKDHIFDVSLHGFPVGMIKTCRRYWNKDIADSIVQLEDIRFENPQFSFSTTFDTKDFSDKLETYFKIKRSVVNDFFETLRKMDYFNDSTLTTAELFNRFFPGRDDVVRFLMEPITYANGSTLQEPAITYGIVFSNFMSKGVYTFRGGTDVLVEKMREELISNNVDIGTRCLVEKIIVDKKRVKGVMVNGREIHARSVLSNVNIVPTVNELVGMEHFSEEFQKKTKDVRINNSSCQVYMGIKKGEKIDFAGDLIFTSEDDTFDSDLIKKMHTKSRTFSLYYPKTRPGHEQYSIVASTNAEYDDWAKLSTEEYAAEKKVLCDNTLRSLEKFLPGVAAKIDHIETATPLTFKRYTKHPAGASFGTKFEGLDISMNLDKQIAGLFHTGSVGIIMSGWLGAANYGVITANNVDRFIHSEKEQEA
jgi:phytoene dehydrogenase-like protein